MTDPDASGVPPPTASRQPTAPPSALVAPPPALAPVAPPPALASIPPPETLAGAIRAAAYGALAVPVAHALLPAAGLLHPKLAAYLRARRHWRAILEAELARRPDVAAGNAIWVHAASGGEFLQARALLAVLRKRSPATPLVYTYTSPSTLPLLEHFRGADLVFPLPPDTRANARAWLDAVVPAASVLVDAEVWPNHVRECAGRGVPVALVSARLGPASRRLRFPARGLYRDLHRRLTCVATVDGATAQVFRAAGVPPGSVRVTGDLRVDETLRRASQVTSRPELPLPGILPVVVAGSTWPDDEAVLLPALERLRDGGTFFALAIAPHDVGEDRLRGLERALEGTGFTAARWSRISGRERFEEASGRRGADGEGADAFGGEGVVRGAGAFDEEVAARGGGATGGDGAGAERARGLLTPATRAGRPGGTLPIREIASTAVGVDALVIDRVGLLYRLYALAAVAFVGGGFRGALHNVMEPAAFGVPIVTGPRTRKSWAAEAMVDACGLFPVADEQACATAIGHLLSGRDAAGAGQRAKGVLLTHAGAAGRTLRALEETGWTGQAEAGATSSTNSNGGTLSS